MRRALARLRRWLQPSLGRRLLLAQIAVMLVLWTTLVGALLLAAHGDNDLLNSDPVFDLALSITDKLAHDPARQAEALRDFDKALRTEYGDGEEDGSFAPVLFVWHKGEAIYRSPPAAQLVRNRQINTVEDVQVDGKTWRMRTRRSATADTEVAIAIPDLPRLLITFNSRGYYILPLLVSLPFLAFPAWWSVRLALRPWRRASEEIATRGPGDLAPLQFQPRHAELKPFVRSINTLLSRVRNSAERERALIADAAHELRTPLAAMRVNVEALHQQSTDPRQRELMDSLLRSNERATRMVAQLLQLMRSDATADAGMPSSLRLDTLVQDRLAEFDGLAAAAGVELELVATGPVTVSGDREGLVSLVDNLVDNAIKYSPRGGTVHAALERTGTEVLLSVSDQGPGIAVQWRERVFDRFFRVPDQVQSGSGLGLAIVQNVAARHGGRASLHEGAGGGLLVQVALPLAPGQGSD
ncbi:two-component system sensor histidine kinase QseC [Acidovorax soli]|uniref:histidine kinase n=1 Tax=Acidovorax soli TaxID=592050 RepID=A0A7X0U881_9BURK|nr:ATP-binding protein [Acidovorax soli]MBB6558494.1 two-component system sensor histidine kinase QseC [Acidovorax soli]